MSAFTPEQLELLERARADRPMWGGSVATDRLRREVELLLALHLIEVDGPHSYKLTAMGAAVLDMVSGVARD